MALLQFICNKGYGFIGLGNAYASVHTCIVCVSFCFIHTGTQPTGNATGHPAICEPVTSADCKTKNSWLTSCDAAGMTTASTTAAPTTTAANTTAAPKTTTSSAVSTKAAFIIPFAVLVVMAAFC